MRDNDPGGGLSLGVLILSARVSKSFWLDPLDSGALVYQFFSLSQWEDVSGDGRSETFLVGSL